MNELSLAVQTFATQVQTAVDDAARARTDAPPRHARVRRVDLVVAQTDALRRAAEIEDVDGMRLQLVKLVAGLYTRT